MTFKHLANTTIVRDDMENTKYQVKVVDEGSPAALVADGYYLRPGENDTVKKVPFIVINHNYDEQELLAAVKGLGETAVEDFTHVEFTGAMYGAEVERNQEKIDEARALLEPVFDRIVDKVLNKVAQVPFKVQLQQGQGDMLETFFMKVQERMDQLQHQLSKLSQRVGLGQGAYGASDGSAGYRGPTGGFRMNEAVAFGAHHPAYERYGRATDQGYRPATPTRQPSETQQPRRVGDPAPTQQQAGNGGRVISSGRFPTTAPGLHDRIGSVGSMLKGMQEVQRRANDPVPFTKEDEQKVRDAVYHYSRLSPAERDIEISQLLTQAGLMEDYQDLAVDAREKIQVMIESQLIRLESKSTQLAQHLTADRNKGVQDICQELFQYAGLEIENIASVAAATIVGYKA